MARVGGVGGGGDIRTRDPGTGLAWLRGMGVADGKLAAEPRAHRLAAAARDAAAGLPAPGPAPARDFRRNVYGNPPDHTGGLSVGHLHRGHPSFTTGDRSVF